MCGLGSFMLQWSGMQTQPSTMTPTTCNLMHTWSTWAVLEASDPGFLSWYMLCVLSHLIIFHYSGNDVGLWSLCPILRNCLNALDCVGRSRYRLGWMKPGESLCGHMGRLGLSLLVCLWLRRALSMGFCGPTLMCSELPVSRVCNDVGYLKSSKRRHHTSQNGTLLL